MSKTRILRTLAPVITALLVLVAASVVGPLGALAAGPTRSPGLPGPHSGAKFSPLHVPSTRVPATSPVSVSSANTCDGGFDFVASPNGTGNNFLFGTSAVSTNDVWAVGISTSTGGFDQTLAEHWNGTTWSKVFTPNPGSFFNDLNSVSAVSTNDVWAVGDFSLDSAGNLWHTFAEHWNGTSWTLITSTPNPTSVNFLFSVTAVSTSDVWAVGTYNTAGFLTLIEHWNGTSWSQAANTPDPSASDNELFAVSAFSSTDVWAVGEFSTGVPPLMSLAQHWDGVAWTTISTPNESGDNLIADVKPLEAGHAVGVGYGKFVMNTTPQQGEAWDLLASGTSTSAPESGPGPGDNVLEGVARSGGSVWAVGFSRVSALTAPQTLVIPATWDSASHTLTWSPVGTSANTSAISDVLFTVTAVSPYAFWAVGYDVSAANVAQTLAESYCALHFSLSAPALAQAGSAFSLTATVEKGNGTTATGYRGTVHFTSSDLSAVLPAAYTFTSVDLGTHTFAGVVLNTVGTQTITAADAVMPITVPGSATIAVCRGVCQAPAGTPGTRGVTNTSPAGTPGPRGANQSGPGVPGPRLPKLGPTAQNGASAPGAAPATATGPAVKVAGAAPVAGSTSPQSAPLTGRAAGAGASSISIQAPTHGLTLVAQNERVSPPPYGTPWWVLLLIPLLVAPAAWRRRVLRAGKQESRA